MLSLSKVIDFVIEPQCKPLEGFNIVWGVTQSHLFFEELPLFVAGERMGRDKVNAVTVAWEVDAIQQEIVGPWLRWWWLREGDGGMSELH